MSSVMNYEENILAAIQTIVNDAVDHASYDRTIQATIKKVVDATTGKYRIAYQDSVFYAYATSADITYSVGTNVYVLIPGNDMSKTKTILGTVDNLGADFINILTNEEIYENMGVNIANSTTEFGLNSYVSEQLIKLYDKTEDINLINLNPEDAEMYIKQNDYITLGAYFKTNLSNEQKAKGNYGISFDFIYENELGENEHRICTIDIDSFNGSPYDLYTYIKQTSTYINFDKDKFKYIDSISIFENGFPYIRSGEPNDIFIKDIQIFGARKIPEEELASCMLSILTPQGTYFKTTDEASATKNLKAQIRVKGKIAGEYDETRFYWFRENASVTKNTRSDLYCSFGGSGWECLNLKNTLGNDIYEWVPADENFSVTKADLMLQENKYKCVALYNDDIVLSREITLYNKSAATMTIESSNGQQFYFDMGQTVLTCTLSEELPNLTYTWRNLYDILDDTTENITVQAKDINRYDIYQCTVYSGDNYVGTANIILYNSLDKTENTRIIINNGTQVFKYTVDGIAPNNNSLEKPITILPLSFTLFDDDGVEITQEKIVASAIEWLVPAENTMITIPDGYGIPTQEDGWNVYNNLRSLNFNILTRYDINKENNVIKLRITLGDRVYTAETNLIFLKEGERGSNGTDFICKVIPNNASNIDSVNQPIVTVYNNNYSLNYTPAQTNCWFKVQLWHDGELIYEGATSGTSTENKSIDLTWSVLQNSYSTTIKDNSNISINKNSGVITFDTTQYEAAANIVQCKVQYDGVEYYDNIPVIVNFLIDNNYQIQLKENTGFKYAIYESDGHNPKFDNSTPFEILVSHNTEDISLADNTNYTWAVGGTYYEHGASHDIINLIPITSYIETHNLTKNQKRYKPIDSYDGLCVNNCIECHIEDGNTSIGTIYIPIDLYINRYGNAALNNWNGNSIQIREEDGLILSPQIGAGKKENDNTFTGMFMGDVQENATTERETGLFGYYHGQRTIELNAENGVAKFGKNGAGQIIMDPTENRAVIRSGNYSATNNTGLEIDLTDPHIKFGNGTKFQVDNQGNVTATTLTVPPSQVTGLTDALDDVTDLKNTINYFEVNLDTDSITIPCTAETQKPLVSANYVVNAQGYFKGSAVTITNITSSDNYTNITFTPSLVNQTITFGVDATKAISNLVSSYNVLFTYINSGTTYTVTKKIDLVLTQQGKDGEQGPAGPAGKDGTSVTIKGSYNTINELIAAHPSGNTLGDGYVVGLDLYVFTNSAGGDGSLAGDWNNVGQFKGEDAKRCFIVASTEVFKSEDGGSTYAPSSTILTPFFQAVTYSSWAYSTNGGSTFITITNENTPTGISIDDSTSALTITNDCELFITNNTLVFKCSSNNASVFDTITIARITDGVSSASTYLTNQTISFTGAADTGIVTGGTSETTNVVCYVGGTKVAPGIGTITGVPNDMNVTVSPNETAAHERLITISIPNDTTLGGVGNQKGTISIPIASPSAAVTTLQLNWMKINAGATGTSGAAGYNTAQIRLYKRANSTPSFSYIGNLTYTFATALLSGDIPAGWTQTIPATDGNPLYEVEAVAYANTATDTIASGEWTSPIKMVEDGLDGNPGTNGINTATIYLYTRNTTAAQSKPYASGSVTYTFATHTLSSIPNNWSTSIPTGTDPLYVSSVTISADTTTYSIPYSSWTTPTKMAQDGTNGRGIASTEVKYIADTQGTTPPADSASWSTNPPSGDNKGKYIWTRTRYTYTDNQNPTTSYSVSYEGNNGQPGDSITITDQSVEYAEGLNGTDIPTSGWQSSIPQVADQHYLWTKTFVEYSDGNSTTSYSVSYQSKDGDDATQYYTYVRYASSATPTAADISTDPTGKTYIGIIVTESSTAPTTGYNWTKFVGEDGYSIWTYATDPTASNNIYTFTRTSLIGPEEVDPNPGEFIYGPRYRYTIATVTSSTVTATVRTDLQGISATNIVCGNEAQTIVCDENGAVEDATTITIPFAGYVGNSRKACSVVVTNLPTGITVTSNTAATTSADGSLILTAAAASTLDGNSSGEITLTFTCNSLTFVKKFTWSKAIAGQDGHDGVSPYISYLTNEAQTIAYDVAVNTVVATTDLYGYQGTTEQLVKITQINNTNISTANTYTNVGLNGIQVSISSKSGNHPTISFKVTSALSQSQTVQVPIKYTLGSDTTTRIIYFSYSTTTQGPDGDDASLVDITASSQIFKSTDGGTTFSPDNIVLTPRFQTVTYGKWQYSLNGGSSWTDASSGSHGLTISSGVLTISKTSDLYTTNITSIVFKCVSSSNDIFDTITVVKLYDASEAEIGGRNFLLKSNTTSGDDSAYLVASYNISDYGHLQTDKKYVLSINFTNSVERKSIRGYIGDSTIGIGDWRAIASAGTHAECWVFTATSDMASADQIINVYCSNNTTGGSSNPMSGTCNINWIKLESGNIPTDWTAAPEDTAQKTAIQYAMTDSATEPAESAWVASLGTQNKNKYIWQRVISYSENGNINIDSAATIIQYPIRSIESTITQYLITQDSSETPASDNPGWSNDKRPWLQSDKDTNYLWYHIVTTYTDGSVETTVAQRDDSWENSEYVFSSIKSITDAINGNINNNVVRIEGGAITVYNDAGGADSATAAIKINSSGIAFMHRPTKDDQWEGEKAAWGYVNGRWVFNSEFIDVLSLKADNITNGKLTLKGTDVIIKQSYSTLAAMKAAHSQGQAGDAYYIEDEHAIYIWRDNAWECGDSGEFVLQDKDNKPLCTIDANGLDIMCADGSRFMVRAQADNNGRHNLQIYDKNGTLFAYTDTDNGVWIVTDAKITKSLQIGDRTANGTKNIKIIPIGNGIGFIAV